MLSRRLDSIMHHINIHIHPRKEFRKLFNCSMPMCNVLDLILKEASFVRITMAMHHSSIQGYWSSWMEYIHFYIRSAQIEIGGSSGCHPGTDSMDLFTNSLVIPNIENDLNATNKQLRGQSMIQPKAVTSVSQSDVKP